MKLLFDENISYRIVKKLISLFPESKQVGDIRLDGLTDRRIWNYAKEGQYTIVTFDADFYDLVTLYGHPPKIIWLRMGNTSTLNIVKAIEDRIEIIKAFLTSESFKDIGCFEINR
jgi:predicted nuclease of predicted toxin-antitoxin system